MRRVSKFSACALALAWVGATGAPSAAQEDAEPAAKKAEPAGEAAAADRPPAAGAGRRAGGARQSGTGAVWWNEPALVEKLSLSEAQRGKMDAHLKAYTDAVQSDDSASITVFSDSLVKGDFKAARTELDQLVKRANAPIRAQGELKINVISELTDEQRAELAEQYPGILRQAWMRGGSGRRGMPPRRPQRARQGRPAMPPAGGAMVDRATEGAAESAAESTDLGATGATQ